jgi:hypothetical protein
VGGEGREGQGIVGLSGVGSGVGLGCNLGLDTGVGPHSFFLFVCFVLFCLSWYCTAGLKGGAGLSFRNICAADTVL